MLFQHIQNKLINFKIRCVSTSPTLLSLRITGPRAIHSAQITGELTDCGDKRGVECVLAKSEEETCLSHSAVPYEQEFEQVIVGLRHLTSRYSLYE